MQLLPADSQGLRRPDHISHFLLHQAAPGFPQKLRVSGGDEGADADLAVYIAFLLQVVVDPPDGQDADPQVVGEGADRGQRLAKERIEGSGSPSFSSPFSIASVI